MQLFYCPEVYDGLFELNAEESRHCIKVLRKEAGDIIHLIDGKGSFYEVEITLASQKKVGFQIVKEWKEAEGDRKSELLDKLRMLNKKKADLEKELDDAVAGKDRNIQLA